MTFKDNLVQDLDTFFNIDEFAEEVEYRLLSDSTLVVVQFFEIESDLGDSMMVKLIARVGDIPNISKDGYFVINSEIFGVIDFSPDDQNIVLNVLLQKRNG
jgi:hypothetical protein